MVAKITYLAGERFGKWVIVSEGASTPRGKNWVCRCDCGNEREVLGTRLRTGKSTSCGCVNTETIKKRLWKGVGELGHARWTSIVRGAKHRNIPITITIEYAWNLFLEQGRVCAITKVPLTMFDRSTGYRTYTNLRGGERGRRVHGTASLDRIDNTKGYIPGNVQWIHKDVNCMKLDHSINRFIELCHLVAQNNPLPVAQEHVLGDDVFTVNPPENYHECNSRADEKR